MSVRARARRLSSDVKTHEQSDTTLSSASRRLIFQYEESGSNTYSPFDVESPAGPSDVARRIGIAKSPGCVVYLKTSSVVKLPSALAVTRSAYVRLPET